MEGQNIEAFASLSITESCHPICIWMCSHPLNCPSSSFIVSKQYIQLLWWRDDCTGYSTVRVATPLHPGPHHSVIQSRRYIIVVVAAAVAVVTAAVTTADAATATAVANTYTDADADTAYTTVLYYLS